jgi:hypothetical protein
MQSWLVNYIVADISVKMSLRQAFTAKPRPTSRHSRTQIKPAGSRQHPGKRLYGHHSREACPGGGGEGESGSWAAVGRPKPWNYPADDDETVTLRFAGGTCI